jgi:hypothetical protein
MAQSAERWGHGAQQIAHGPLTFRARDGYARVPSRSSARDMHDQPMADDEVAALALRLATRT